MISDLKCKCKHVPQSFVVYIYRKDKKRLRYCDQCVYKLKDQDVLKHLINALLEKRK